MRRPDLSSLMFSVAWKEKNSVWVKHSADLPAGQYCHKSQFRYNELQPISFGVRYSRINWTSFLYFLWTFWVKTCWKSPCECRTSPKEGRNSARWDKEWPHWRLTQFENLYLFWNIKYITQSFFFLTFLLLGFIIFINVLVYWRWQVYVNFRGEKYIGLIPVLPMYY